MQKRKKASVYSQKLALFKEKMDYYKQHYAARYIQVRSCCRRALFLALSSVQWDSCCVCML